MSSFYSAKATHIFSAKNIRILYIEFAKTVNEMTLSTLVKLTTLCTTGPCCIAIAFVVFVLACFCYSALRIYSCILLENIKGILKTLGRIIADTI